jgi:hypothetical protein
MAMDAVSTELNIEAVLRTEAKAIHNEDIAEGTNGKALNQALNALNSTALCLSGGGIRSAAFSLGIIQALAVHPRSDDVGAPVEYAEKSLLSKFRYLSTVSGGGYIGSWLSAFRLRNDFRDIWKSLVGRPDGPDKEPPVISWLRSYSNYLTPRLGLLSGDTWASVALSVRNLVLNWLVILPAVCSLILLIKIVGIGSDSVTRIDQSWPALQLDIAFAVVAVACLIKALAFTTHNRPSRQPKRPPNQKQIFFGSLLFSIVSAVFAIQALASDYFDKLFLNLDQCCNPKHPISPETFLQPLYPMPSHLAVGAVIGVLIYAASWIVAWPNRRNPLDFVMWSIAGAIYGALLGLGFYFWIQIPQAGIGIFSSVVLDLVFGIPWILFSQIVAEMIFIGLASYQPKSDDDREWLGRASGLLVAVIVGWFVLTFFIYFGAILGENIVSQDMRHIVRAYSAPIAGLSGIVTAILGKSSASPAKGAVRGFQQILTEAILKLAAVIFIAALLVGLSFALDHLLLGENLVPALFDEWSDPDSTVAPDRVSALELFAGGLGLFLLIGAAASWCININRFSLHSLYRNRLIRAFLGARSDRKADPFTDFDAGDNPQMKDLWSPAEPGNWRPFHVINIALNIVSSKRLAWQERKAEPFTVTALHSGSGYLGFRPSQDYGAGITLGTAMAISGAAASPNMGYNSSPVVTFLMTLFNVRLGWWLGNPGPKGERTYANEGPTFAINPLLNEAFGATTDDRNYVYLSDGGHFENLGLYEMVRRRCRLIVVSDAGCDPEFKFEDLGNAVRKIAIDLGVAIRFDKLEALTPRDAPDGAANQSYHAIAEVDYRTADGGGENGVILYVKPGLHGNESVGVRSYAMAHPDFPHQSTLDQWFTESQFESYRALGFEIMDGVLSRTLSQKSGDENPSLRSAFFPAPPAADKSR